MHIKYKILEDLFTEQGPILIGSKFFSAEGLKVQFTPQNEPTWVGNFQKGTKGTNAIYELQRPLLLIFAGGYVHIIDFEKKSSINTLGDGDNYREILQAPDSSIILANSTKITIINPDAEIWNSKRISWSGIERLKLDGDVLTGMCFDPTDKNIPWKPFSLNIKTKETAGGTYNSAD